MKTWTRFGIGAAALALAIAAGTGAYAMRAGSDDAQQSAAADDRDGDQAQEGGGLGISAVCIEGVPDCVDTIVDVPYDDFGETAGGGIYECVTLDTDPPTEECKLVGCESLVHPGVAPTDPGDTNAPPGDIVEPLTPEEAERLRQAEGGGSDPDAAQQDPPVVECPPVTPICDDPTTSACIPPDCAVSSDGSVSCPVPAPIDCAPAEPAVDDTVSTLPCGVEPCQPGPATDCGVTDPCVPGPATDCGVVDCTLVDPEVDAPEGQPELCLPGVAIEPDGSGGGSAGSTGEGATESAPAP